MYIENIIKIEKGVIQIEVKKRNLERRILPLDNITVEGVKYVVKCIEAHNKNMLITLNPIRKRRMKFKDWLIKNRINVPIQIANSFKHSCCMVMGHSYELINDKYEYLWNKEVVQVKKQDEVVRVWLA